MITLTDIIDASPTQLYDVRDQLVVAKMKLDKFFSIFLDENEMDDNNTDTAAWLTYREMTKEYERVTNLIKSTDYYISHRA